MDKFNHIKYTAEQLFDNGNLDIVDTVFSESYIAHMGDKSYKGHKFIKQFVKKIRVAIPNIKVVKIKLLSNTENTICWQRTLSGTHKESLKGIPPSNKKVNWYEMVVSRFENDKIIEEWIVSDLAFQLLLKLK